MGGAIMGRSRRTVGMGLLLGFLVAFGTVGVSARAAEPAATVLTLKGDCAVDTGGKHTLLVVGSELQVGDAITVAEGAKLKIRLRDGSVISAASGTKMTITELATGGGHRDAAIALADGLLRAVVAPASQPSHFEVDTANGVAAVRSTDWFVEAAPGSTRVGVLTGLVSLTSRATDHAVDIPARWGARLETGKDPVQPRIWQDSEFDAVIARTDL